MGRFAIILGIFLVVHPALAEAPLKRLTLRQDLLGWEAVGRVEMGDKGYCTGVLIAPDLVLTAAPFEVAALAPRARDLSVVSYGRGRDDALSLDDACRVRGHARGLIAFDCDVTFGSSGAPVFQRKGNRAAIVSLVSMGGNLEGEAMAFGMELPQAVAELKAALARGEGASAGQPKAPVAAGGRRSAGGAKFLSP